MKLSMAMLLLVLLAAIGQAKIIHVPGNQPTIQAGINAASSGDTVLVAPGTYYENINFSGKAITVKSSKGPKVTIIDGSQLNSVVTFSTDEGPNSILHGFTIQNGSASAGSANEGGGINIFSASPTVTGNIVTNNNASTDGGGIAVLFSAAIVKGNTVSNNSQTSGFEGGVGGGGIEVGGAGSAQIIGNVIVNNSWSSASGGGMSLDAAASPTVENNIIAGNTAFDQGGGIYIVNDSDALLVQNLFYNNTAQQGSGIYLTVPYGDRGPLLVNNTIIGTGTSALGSAVYADGYYDQVLFYNNLMIGASGTTALYCDDTYDAIPPRLLNNDGYSAAGTGIGGACSAQSETSGNISADPKFVGATNFRLKRGSPAIDAGDNSAPDLPTKDLAGKPRIVNGTIDIGAYEHPN